MRISAKQGVSRHACLRRMQQEGVLLAELQPFHLFHKWQHLESPVCWPVEPDAAWLTLFVWSCIRHGHSDSAIRINEFSGCVPAMAEAKNCSMK